MGRVLKLPLESDQVGRNGVIGCDYWHDERMKCMIEGTDSHIHDFDGCMYGLTTQFGDRHMPIKKPWRIVSWGIKFELHKKCDRRHDHGKCEGRETRITQTHTKQIVDIILKTVCRYVSIRFKKSLCQMMMYAAVVCMTEVQQRRQRSQSFTTMMKYQLISCG